MKRVNRKFPDEAEIERAREEFEQCRSRLYAAKIAYMNRTPFEGVPMTYESLKLVAQQTIQANYRLQRLQFGKIRLKLSVAKLLRRSW